MDFLVSFDEADAPANMPMVTMNINSGQDTATFSSDKYKMTHCYLHLLEHGKGGWNVSYKTGWILVSSPTNQYFFRNVMPMWDFWKAWGDDWVRGGGSGG